MNSDERSGWNELMEVIKMENHQSPHWSMSLNSPESQHMSNVQPQSPVSPVPAQNNLAQNQNLRSPHLRIVEQPAAKALRFRYECEGRSAGSIPGANSTPENKTFPTVEIVNYDKDAVIVVSCVTKDSPYRPHPHKVVGRDGGGQKYDNGICEVKLKAPNLRAVFSNLGIQCVKRREVATSLKLRRDRKINPFNVPYPSPDQKSTYDLNVVRLCFQAFINPTGKSWEPLEPKISEPIYDKKGVFDLKICGLCNCSGNVKGGDRIILLCEKVDKTDIKIKFSECNNEGEIKWTKYADFQQSDVHKQTAITFRTPRYERTDITESVKVYIQLERPTDGGLSEPLEFEYYPDPGMRTFTRIRRKIKRKEELDFFQQILSLDSETTATKYSCPPTDLDDNETVSSDSSASKPNSSDSMNEYDGDERRLTCRENDIVEEEIEMLRRSQLNTLEFEVPKINYPVADDCTQTSTPMDEILGQQQQQSFPGSCVRRLSTEEKIAEWMRSSEFERTDSLTVENGDTVSLSPVTVYSNVSYSSNNQSTISTDDEKTFTELMEKLVEVDETLDTTQSRRGTLENPILNELPMGGDEWAVDIPQKVASAHPSVDLSESFDETATYTSLKFALKNPIDIPSGKVALNDMHYRKSSQSSSMTATTEEDLTGLVVLTNPPAPKIKVNAAQTPPSPPLPVPPRTPSPGPEQMGPPLPPKRRVSHEINNSTINSSKDSSPRNSVVRTRNGSLPARPTSQIIIMRTPDHSPTKRHESAMSTPSPKKKQGFFARLFSRKSKADIKVDLPPPEPPTATPSIANDSKGTTPTQSREPSIGNFSLADPNRSSMRSAKSLQPHSPGLSPHSSTNVSVRSAGAAGKPIGRSASSASGKRPAYLDADVIHIPLKGDDDEKYRGTISTFGRQLDRKTLSALHLADIPVCDGNMELVAIADRQSIKNLCEGDFNVILDPGVDLSEAEHFALYTSITPESDFAPNDDSATNVCDSQTNDALPSPLLTADEIAMRLAQANGLD